MAILVVVSILLLRFLLQPGFPETHDGQNHIARLANLHLASIDRHFPFRWAPNLNYKFGYPVFNFNYYLPQVAALAPVKLGFSFESSLKLVIGLSLLVGGVFWYLLLRKWFNKWPALAGALLYITAPYQLVNIWVRGSVGEIVAFGLLPFLLWLIVGFFEKPKLWKFALLTLGMTAFMLSHNIMVLFGMPLLLAFIVVSAWQTKSWRRLKWMGLILGLGIGMSLFFWLPALGEKQFTNIDQVNLSYQYKDHFPSFRQLLKSDWGYGFSVPGNEDSFTFELGPFHWLAVVLAGLGLVVNILRKQTIKNKKIWGFFIGIFLLSLLSMMKFTFPVWQIIPFVHYIQFPWRLLIFSCLGAAFLGAGLVQYLPKLGVCLVIGAVSYALLLSKPGGWFHWDNYFHYEFPFNTSVLGENMPRWFEQEKNHTIEGKIFDLKGVASIRELEWKTQKHSYQIDSPMEAEIWERTAYFPGWEVYVDGEKTEINYQHEDYPGVITFSVPPGKHEIKTVLTENTPARRLGNALSLVSLTVFLGIIFINRLSYVKIFKEKKAN